ncbi:MAG: sigma 54-interacting transcriptional regulator [Halioglobus sp.]
MLTIIFHPEPERIGEVTSLLVDEGESAIELGRNGPGFCHPSEGVGSRSLDDPHISRQALMFSRDKKSLVLTRDPDASRCQVNGKELNGELHLAEEQLSSGVTLFLAHRVVLLFRKVVCRDAADVETAKSSDLKGNSPYMQELREQITTAAANDVDVLICGETGTGKELVASAIHANSQRRNEKLLPVNMAAIPASLAPSILFGNARGAYTGAETSGVGYFEQAQGGTLFLDEVGDTPPEIQAQLLRALQQREIQRVGGSVHKVDLRVIAATDAPLDEGSDFKAALRHRLGSCEISLKPLREHPEDIGELLWFFLQKYLGDTSATYLLPHPESDRRDIAFWAELFHLFLGYSWPGNVRQLSNFAQQVAMASTRELVLPADLRAKMIRENRGSDTGRPHWRKNEDVSDDEFLSTMEAALYEPTKVSRLLKLHRTAVYRRMESFPFLRVASQVPEAELQEALLACEGDIDKVALILRVSRAGLRSRLKGLSKAGQ